MDVRRNCQLSISLSLTSWQLNVKSWFPHVLVNSVNCVNLGSSLCCEGRTGTICLRNSPNPTSEVCWCWEHYIITLQGAELNDNELLNCNHNKPSLLSKYLPFPTSLLPSFSGEETESSIYFCFQYAGRPGHQSDSSQWQQTSTKTNNIHPPGSRIQGHFLNIQLLHCPGNSQESWLGYTWLHSHWAKPICRVSYILCNKYSIRICTNYQLLQISSRPDDWLRITGDVRTFQRIMKRWSVSGSGKHLGALYFPFIRNLFTRQ